MSSVKIEFGGITMAAVAEMLLDEINAKEDLSLRLGDALDVKASIGLALILFLATQTAYFIDKGGLSLVAVIAQLFSIVCVVLGALFALLELWPRMYVLPDPESEYVAQRIEQLTEHYSHYEETESNVSHALMKDQIQWAKMR